MDKQKVMDYILNSPQNTNPAVLSSVLDSFGASDNKEEIELSATENKVYTPEEGKVYKKVTVNVASTGEAKLVKANVDIAIDAGDYGAMWSSQETKRFADVVEEIEKGNIVILSGLYMSNYWGIFELTEKTESSLKFEHMDAPFELTINSNNFMTLVHTN